MPIKQKRILKGSGLMDRKLKYLILIHGGSVQEDTKIDMIYKGFSLQKWYGITVLERKQFPGSVPCFEPWILPDEDSGKGVKDFKARNKADYGYSIFEKKNE